jgi:hypothetical protein
VTHHPEVPKPAYYQWINDNNGALAWARKHKCASLAGQYTCFAVTQMHILASVHIATPVHKPGLQMGDIDTMSRIPDGQHPTSATSQAACPTLSPECWWNIDALPELHTLFVLIDPSSSKTSTHEYHVAYNTVYTAVRSLLDAIESTNSYVPP